MYNNKIEIEAKEIFTEIKDTQKIFSLDEISAKVRERSRCRIARTKQPVVFEFVLCDLKRAGVPIQQ